MWAYEHYNNVQKLYFVYYTFIILNLYVIQVLLYYVSFSVPT